MVEKVEKVVVTEAALTLLEEIRAEHGDVVFKISAGCCDGTGPMCFREADVMIGVNDIKLGDVDKAGIWAAPSIADLWKNSQMILDAGPGSGAGFSLDNGRTTHFLTRSRILHLDE
ncbi:hypothetical protein ALP8811_00465 [Aliiroseovarius pelagivivens]|uniref:Acetaldehyde dehydrogenase n=1 Tax=Aliiroseovarius pelagivivens TaxID=1639690 RepID=A0A2R8AHG2_9RHOB|nr:DUF779 domain-containing protein [Aliiroseovarius pelagivivens]SPF75475.1 hypothetical protein ALP8811_00465 [Aliiroseovarius pelagivivens]